MRACVLTFAPHSGTTTQTVTGVQDADGTFVGKWFLFQSAYVALNVLTAGNVAYPWYADSRGVDTGSVRSAASTADTYSPFNFKAVSGALSLGNHSILEQWTDNFGSVHIEREAKIAAIRDGEFDVSYTVNTRNGDDIAVLVIGGDDIDVTFTAGDSGTYATASKPQGLLTVNLTKPAASGSTSGGTGGGAVQWGFATRDGDYGGSALYVNNQSTNYIGQLTDRMSVGINPSGVIAGAGPTVSAWNDLSLTIANGPSNPTMAFCSDTLVCAGGAVNQSVSTGAQVINLGIAAIVVWFWSVGAVTSASSSNPVGQMVMGWTTGPSQQIGWWSGERTPGNVSPAYGCRYLSNSSVLRFGTPQGASTTFNSVASVTDLSPSDQTVTLNWSSVDGTAREIIWFAIGETVVPPPTPSYHTRTLARRRLRRSPIVWAEKDGLQTTVRVNLIAVDMQPGVGTTDTPEPLVMIRASKDGGRTWSNERLMQAGRVGAYTQRLNTWRWGQGRQWVVEVSTSDPVTFNLVQLLIDAEPGNA